MASDERNASDRGPTREEVDRTAGALVLEFGATWCGHCQAMAPQLAAMLAAKPDVRHVRIEDGPGRPLGRSFRVKLWPTLVFLNDGQVVGRAVRPSLEEIRAGLDAIAEAATRSGGESVGGGLDRKEDRCR
jgi:thioredoxin 1